MIAHTIAKVLKITNYSFAAEYSNLLMWSVVVSIFTDHVCSTTEDNVFTRVYLFTYGAEVARVCPVFVLSGMGVCPGPAQGKGYILFQVLTR